MKKTLLSLLLGGVMVASAAVASFRVSVLRDSMLDGKQIKAGDYKVEVENNMATLKRGKEVIQVPAREETAPSKFEVTELQYSNDNDLQEICIGGTNTRIVFSAINSGGTGNNQ